MNEKSSDGNSALMKQHIATAEIRQSLLMSLEALISIGLEQRQRAVEQIASAQAHLEEALQKLRV